MAFLLKQTKEVLLEVAIDLGVEVNSTLTKSEIKNRICQSEDYNEESVKSLLEGILAEKREARELKERQEPREYELERLRLSNATETVSVSSADLEGQGVSAVPGFLPDDRHTASPCWTPWWVEARQNEVFLYAYGSKFAVPGKGLVLPNLSIDETAQRVRFLLISLPNNAMSVKSPFTIHKALKGIGGEPKSIKRLRSGDLLVETSSSTQTKSFLLAKTFLDSPVNIIPLKSLNTSRGVISEPDL
ncbi:uncharacterized protein TNCV_1919961 [Trichonephila clavipes]|nr:uncharacterized protein TNCV_1919961 [Trichonephila clavipes]